MRLIPVLVATALAPALAAQPRFPDVSPPAAMGHLDYLVGAWRATVEFFDGEGQPSGTLESATVVKPILDGVALEQEGRLVGTPMATRSAYFVDRATGRVTWWTLDSMGNEHVFHGDATAGGLTLVSRPVASDGGDVAFKRVDAIHDADSYEYALYASRDGGNTWRPVNRQLNCRVTGPTESSRPPVLAALDVYVGDWVAEERRETADGDAYRFLYRLKPFDAAGTIVEMTVAQRPEADGATRVLWHGYKGWDPASGSVYYHGFSPSGRLSRGSLYLDADGALVTEYDGWAPKGGAVRIKDVFTRLGADRFRSVTFMTRDGEWREINRDHWRRRSW